MKRILVFFLALIGVGYLANDGLLAQDYNELLVMPQEVRTFAHYETMVEDPNQGTVIMVSTVDEFQFSPNTDISIQVLDQTGNVVVSPFRVGIQGESELAFGVSLTDNPDEVIIVGENQSFPGGRQALVMRVDLQSNSVIWASRFDAFPPIQTRQRFNGITKITNSLSGQEEYFLYGTVQEVTGGGNSPWEKIYLVRIDGNGNMLFTGRYFDAPNLALLKGDYVPTDIAENSAGNYVLIGNFIERDATGAAGRRDIFLFEFDTFGQAVSGFHLYNASEIQDSARLNERPCLIADNNSNVYGLAFDSFNLGIDPNVGRYATLLLVDQATFFPVSNPMIYWDNNYQSNRVSGFGIDPNTGDYLIGTRHASPNGIGNELLGLLSVDPVTLNPNGLVQYDPGLVLIDGYSMIVGDQGVYHQATRFGTNNLAAIRTDHSGVNGPYSCNTPIPVDFQTILRDSAEEITGADNEYEISDITPDVNNISGDIIWCDGTTGNFKKPQQLPLEANLAGLEVVVYPSHIDAYQSVQVKIAADEQVEVAVRVTNLMGQVLYQGKLTIDAGTSELELPASALGTGLNLIQFQDATGSCRITKRVIKH